MNLNDSPHSDTLVFFGATGDLAFKKIFPALQAMVKRGNLSVPVIGVGKAGCNLDQLKARAKDSLEKHGGLDSEAFDKLCNLLRYVDGDYNDAATFQALRREMASAQRPAHYLAIPPAAFATVVEQLSQTNCTRNARVIIEKPFGRDLASARDLNAILLKTFDEQAIFRIDHYLGKQPVHSMLFFRFANEMLEPFWNRSHIDSVQSHPCAAEMDAYERVLGDAMAGDATLFAREDYVEEAWRIVDPVLKAGAPLHEYEPKTWGPIGNGNVTPPGGWHNPVVNG